MPTKKKSVRKRTASPRKPILTFQGMLAELRRFFNEAGLNEQAQLWDVLSALRGPDEDVSPEVKRSTTSVVRNAIIANSAYMNSMVSVDADGDDKKTYRQLMDSARQGSFHFRMHAHAAFCALGLAWDKVNDKSKFI